MSELDDFDAAVRLHDARIAAAGQVIWVGSEPTFTDRHQQTPEWLNTALGETKEGRARAVVAGLARLHPGSLVLRSVGRQYPGEPSPRWNLGLLRRRDGAALWHGPRDPLEQTGSAAIGPVDLDAWSHAFAAALAAGGFAVAFVPSAQGRERRLLMRPSADVAAPDAADPRLLRPSVHGQPTPASGLRDTLAETHAYLFVLALAPADAAPRIELPQFTDVRLFADVLGCLQIACAALPTLIVAGYSPPTDAAIELTTVTPDPAVVEINTAPSVSGADFLQRSREVYAAATMQGLEPYRLYFNGHVADSGGGGQITLGGPTPLASPFLLEPRLLPRLVRFVNRHPCLSYLFSHDFVGSSGQSVRADERGSDAFDELVLALDLMARQPPPAPERLWHSLAPFLCDALGNSHRAEMNIEKLWNPFLAGRGRLGLVEFRALRMQHTPERATALACLLRSVVAMLAGHDDGLPLIDWGRELHERFALPFYLERDLDQLLQLLAAAGFGLDDPIRAVLRRESFRRWGQVELPGGCSLEVRRALEFWPLLGDAASPEQGGGSRLVDASTARIELRLRPLPAGAGPDWQDWQVIAAGVALPMRPESDDRGRLQVFGLRYRAFVPGWGLHPALGTQTPVRLRLRHPARADDRLVTLHEWHPAGAAYPGLPEDLADAARRRGERVTVEMIARDTGAAERPAPVPGLGAFCLDLRAAGRA